MTAHTRRADAERAWFGWMVCAVSVGELVRTPPGAALLIGGAGIVVADEVVEQDKGGNGLF